MVSVLTLTPTASVPSPTAMMPGVEPHPVPTSALHAATSTTATSLAAVPMGTYRVCVAGFSTGVPGSTPTVAVRCCAAHPAVSAALQVAMLIIETVRP